MFVLTRAASNINPLGAHAFQGFNSCCFGPLVRAAGQELLLAQSYAKNMGLYGERIGALSVVCHW